MSVAVTAGTAFVLVGLFFLRKPDVVRRYDQSPLNRLSPSEHSDIVRALGAVFLTAGLAGVIAGLTGLMR